MNAAFFGDRTHLSTRRLVAFMRISWMGPRMAINSLREMERTTEPSPDSTTAVDEQMTWLPPSSASSPKQPYVVTQVLEVCKVVDNGVSKLYL